MTKLELHIDSTALGNSGCILKFIRSIIGEPSKPELGAYRTVPKASMIYGVAVHKFRDVMFKTKGHFPTARKEAELVFNLPKRADPKKEWQTDPKHLITTCFNYWTNNIETESSFEMLEINQPCYWCEGTGHSGEVEAGDGEEIAKPCKYCKGEGIVKGPATELTFSLKIYEDDFCIIYLEGTMDGLGKFKGGVWAIGDLKSTSAWKQDEYLESYELSRQLRVYTYACKIMARTQPDSILGQIGKTRMGAFIDGLFVKPKANDNEFQRSRVMQFSDEDIAAFERTLLEFCKKLSFHVQANYFPKEGILNGLCDGKWGFCDFWHACKSPEHISQLLLKRDFKRTKYDPMNFNDTSE